MKLLLDIASLCFTVIGGIMAQKVMKKYSNKGIDRNRNIALIIPTLIFLFGVIILWYAKSIPN
jgi:hypothetical protein